MVTLASQSTKNDIIITFYYIYFINKIIFGGAMKLGLKSIKLLVHVVYSHPKMYLQIHY